METIFTTTNGIDKALFMVHLLEVVCGDVKSSNNNTAKLKSFIEEQIHRCITNREYINLLSGIEKYLIADAGSKERMESMQYLFEGKFLEV